jgi:hypothetical protein
MWQTDKAKKPAEQITCSLVKPSKVIIEALAKQKIELLMKEYPSQEWLSYMVGETEPVMRIKDIVIPPHASASSGSAEAEPLHVPEHCLGVLHSHHHMGAFHSGTDDAYVDRNYPLSITVAIGAQGLDFDAIMWQTTPCGKLLLSKCSITFVYPLAADLTEFLAEAKANIQKGVHVYHAPVSAPSQGILFAPDRPYHPKKDSRKWPVNATEDCGAGYWYKGGYITKEEYDKIMASIWKDGNK